MTLREEIAALPPFYYNTESLNSTRHAQDDVLAIIDRREAKAFGDLATPSEERPAREELRMIAEQHWSTDYLSDEVQARGMYAIIESIDALTAAIREKTA
jgi:hypothetical protein